MLLTHLSKKHRKENARTVLDIVRLSDRLDRYPRQLSGGQEQRVAIARAIVDPVIILADKPTGDLDAASAKEVLRVLTIFDEQHGNTTVIATHDPRAAKYAQGIRYLEKGDLLPEGQLPEDGFTTTAPA